MQFLSARQAISDAYNGSWRSNRDDGDQGVVKAEKRPECPECGSPHIRRREKTITNCSTGTQRTRSLPGYRCTNAECRKEFTKPRMAASKAPVQRSTNEGVSDNCYRIWHQLQAREVFRVVEEGLSPAERTWVLYAYSDVEPDYGRLESLLMDWLAKTIDTEVPSVLNGLVSFGQATQLMLLLIQDARSRESCARPRYKRADLARLVFGSASPADQMRLQEDRPWGRFAATVETQLGRLNARALGPVARLVEDMRERDDKAA